MDAFAGPTAGGTASDAELMLAAAAGQADEVEELLHGGADANWQLDSGATPLYIASRQGHNFVVEALLQLGRARVADAMRDGSTPLFITTWHGHMTVARELLSARANVNNGTASGATPLFAAAMCGHQTILEELLRRRAHVEQTTRDGVTPLMAAAAAGHPGAVRSLLHGDADAAHLREDDGATALSVAERNGHSEVCRILRATLVARGLPRLALAACDRRWRAQSRTLLVEDLPTVEVAERTALVELVRAAHRAAILVALEPSPSRQWSSVAADAAVAAAAAAAAASGAAAAAAYGMDGSEALVLARHTGAVVPHSVEPASEALEQAEPYLRRAAELENREPVVAYYCRVFAAGLLLNSARQGCGDITLEITLMGALEAAERAKPLLQLWRGREDLEAFVLASTLRAEEAAASVEQAAARRESVAAHKGIAVAKVRDASLFVDVLEWLKSQEVVPHGFDIAMPSVTSL
mmetsp:Transcript_40020/g.128338  ORF Transcript_40020/g.128338 Transcript_40020/m.128338 type:complete len:469 (-) Transcript_40020:113-1519(-)|eukprot:CAMPEP_0203847758 /NCGR_PEP_ID=MMETSP0359-20131031/5191_1 /ASSEMBLY_ACC=CAM_ASM_000338 /TAXON_ID=268821 /ORGANISM="Scrippsiella Hangoei, Strain SHTV-5" /LENGTH=468 /DNA_ID=CAMNT_0050763255 /DNA_START=100 /DNA_END=1506 /DNA_ORIENTATION=+